MTSCSHPKTDYCIRSYILFLSSLSSLSSSLSSLSSSSSFSSSSSSLSSSSLSSSSFAFRTATGALHVRDQLQHVAAIVGGPRGGHPARRAVAAFGDYAAIHLPATNATHTKPAPGTRARACMIHVATGTKNKKKEFRVHVDISIFTHHSIRQHSLN